MKRQEKIETTIKEERIFLVSETDRFEYFICKGVNKRVYDIIYFKGEDKWKCNCDNVRLTPCYHIEAAKRLKENDTAKEDKAFSNICSGSVIANCNAN